MPTQVNITKIYELNNQNVFLFTGSHSEEIIHKFTPQIQDQIISRPNFDNGIINGKITAVTYATNNLLMAIAFAIMDPEILTKLNIFSWNCEFIENRYVISFKNNNLSLNELIQKFIESKSFYGNIYLMNKNNFEYFDEVEQYMTTKVVIPGYYAKVTITDFLELGGQFEFTI